MSVYIAVEMLVDRKIQDDWGREAELQYTHLRYELELVRYPDSYQPYTPRIKYESLRSISLVSNENQSETTESSVFFVDTDTLPDKPDKPMTADLLPGSRPVVRVDLSRPAINLYSEGKGESKSFLLGKARRTALSSVIDVTFPHAFAAREALRSLKLLHLNPEVLRQPGSTNAPGILSSHGGNLPTTLARMLVEDKFALSGISRDLANLVPDLITIELKKDEVRNEYIIWAKYQDGRSFSSQVLSDGTLQLLALVTLKNDPQFSGVLCFEEPENGVHPSYLTGIAHLLRGLTTDFNDPEQAEEPLRQVLVTTHSPTFISQPDVIDALLLTYTMTHVEPSTTGIPPMRFTHAAPVLVDSAAKKNVDKWAVGYTIDQVKELLTRNHLDEALERLDKSRMMLDER